MNLAAGSRKGLPGSHETPPGSRRAPGRRHPQCRQGARTRGAAGRALRRCRCPCARPRRAGRAGNALFKARFAAEASGLVAIADDSGLCVAVLDGEPGIHSARWAGPERDFGHAMNLVETRMAERDGDDPAAWFICALAVAWPGGPGVTVEGRIDGALSFPPRGRFGFGYDPIFVPDGRSETFGEMDPAAKDAMSHRARAFAALEAALF